MVKIEINPDNYLSDNDKRELIEDEYRNIIREKLKQDNFGFKTLDRKQRMSNAQRLMSNAIYYILENESEEILGAETDLKDTIKRNVKKTILNKKDYSYSIFSRKGIYDKEDSLGQQILNDAIIENKPLIKRRVRESIENFFKKDDDYLTDWMNEAIAQVLIEKLKHD